MPRQPKKKPDLVAVRTVDGAQIVRSVVLRPFGDDLIGGVAVYALAGVLENITLEGVSDADVSQLLFENLPCLGVAPHVRENPAPTSEPLDDESPREAEGITL